MGFVDDVENEVKKNTAAREERQKKDEWFSAQEGDNNIRVLLEPVKFNKHFKHGIVFEGAPFEGSARFLTWVIDRKDQTMRLYEMPLTVAEPISKMKKREDSAFESFPMPYDVIVTKKITKGEDGDRVTYVVAPARKDVPVTDDEMKALNEKTLPDYILAKWRAKKQKEFESTNGATPAVPATAPIPVVRYDEEDINPDDIPF